MLNKRLEKLLYRVQKPGRYIAGEKNSVVKDKEKVTIRFALGYPDLYEVGMSNLGIKILYELLNNREDTWCERFFAPAADMEKQLRENEFPIYGLESGDSLKNFDFVGFSLQFELNYTNILQILDLADIPFYASQRDELYPLIIAGGPCAVNSEPIAEFFDLIMLGDCEENLPALLDLYAKHKGSGLNKAAFLADAAQMTGVYVPSLYTVTYDGGNIKSIAPDKKVLRCIISDLDSSFIPKKPVVPTIQAIHDRMSLELFRGCTRGCRFCQAGMIYRPARYRSAQMLDCAAKEQFALTGFDEISLLSLSSSDYPEINDLIDKLSCWTTPRHIKISLPSLRIDNMPKELIEKIGEVKMSGLTFAPEAGSQRLRDAINKNISREEIMDTCRDAFVQGYTTVKLYFMVGLPTETDEDIEAIAALGQDIVNLYYSLPSRGKYKGVNVNVSLSTFVPKSFTPFQWEGQIPKIEIIRRQRLLFSSIRTKKITVKWNDPEISAIEAAFARGDRRLCRVIETAYLNGARFDSWDESFDAQRWAEAFLEHGLSVEEYANRQFSFDDILPWDIMDIGVSKEYLKEENIKAKQGETTSDCRSGCSDCGISKTLGVGCNV